MTTELSISDTAARLKAHFGEGVAPAGDGLATSPELLPRVAGYLRDTAGFDFDFLDMMAAVDYADRFELVYRLLSLKHNHTLTLRVNCDKNKAVVPSLAGLWQGADLQEREIYDLFGISFNGHPNLKRIVLWEGFEGHPLRKDFKDGAYGAGD